MRSWSRSPRMLKVYRHIHSSHNESHIADIHKQNQNTPRRNNDQNLRSKRPRQPKSDRNSSYSRKVYAEFRFLTVWMSFGAHSHIESAHLCGDDKF